MEHVNITIIGGGAVGGALAYELSKTSLESILVVDPHKNVRRMDDNQSVRNSGVIHAGVYYDQADRLLKAQLGPRGNELLYQFCQKYDIPHRKTGKLIVATEDWQLEYLDDVERVANQNGVPDVVRLRSQREIQDLEPNVVGIAALHVPTSGIIDPVVYLEKLHQLAGEKEKVTHLWGSRVTGITPSEAGFEITIDTLGQEVYTFETRYVINAAGLHADDVAKMLNPDFPYVIRGTPGESAMFYQKRTEIETKMNVYPAPYAHDLEGKVLEISPEEAKDLVKEGTALYTVGVHLTPTLGDGKGNYGKDSDGEFTLDKTVTIGPAKNKYTDTKDFAVLKKDYDRLKRDPSYYHTRVHSFFPGLQVDDVGLHQFGVMATIKGHPDWVIERDKTYPNCTHLAGIDSPGLTGSLAIAEYVRNTSFGGEELLQ